MSLDTNVNSCTALVRYVPSFQRNSEREKQQESTFKYVLSEPLRAFLYSIECSELAATRFSMVVQPPPQSSDCRMICLWRNNHAPAASAGAPSPTPAPAAPRPLPPYQEGHLSFPRPEKCFPRNPRDKFYIVKVKIDGEFQWLPAVVIRLDYPGLYKNISFPNTNYSMEELFVHLAVTEEQFNIEDVLREPDHPFNVRKLVALFSQFPAHLFALGENNLECLLKVAKSVNISIQCRNVISPETRENLLFKWIRIRPLRDEKEPTSVVQTMLEQEPKLASCYGVDGQSPLEVAITFGREADANLLIEAVQKSGRALSISEQWLLKAFKNDAAFDAKEFCALNDTMKKQIYRIANIYGSRDVVAKLNPLMQLPRDRAPPFSCNILSEHMDAIAAHNTIEKFLADLRASKRLLTEKEFESLEVESKMKFKRKVSLGRLLGADFIQRTVKRLGLRSVKVPLKVAVVDSHRGTIAIHSGLGTGLQITAWDLDVYAQVIPRSDRYLSKQEMEELVTLMAEVDFGDIHDINFLIAEDGVYAIDTEYKSFYGLEWAKMHRLSSMVAPADKAWFHTMIDAREKEHDALQKSLREARGQIRAIRTTNNEWFGLKDRMKPFVFDLQQFLKQYP